MNCDNCGKPAFIQVKIVGPFGARDVNLCHDCYEEYMNNYTWKSVAKRIIKHFLSE